MATTIKSTELDFNSIKENLKNFLKESGEFNDYDFEGSGLSNLLDVLSYNTHYNGLITNFALNESFLKTAQLRPSVVSLAESIGYVPNSRKSSECQITLTLSLSGVPNLLQTQTLQAGSLVLRGSKDGIDYTFTNRESITASASSGVYTFAPTADPELPVKVFEGVVKTENFLVGAQTEAIYVIPDLNMDIRTAIVKVFENQLSANVDGGSGFTIYTDLIDATTIREDSRLYVLQESPNGYYELSFGNGNSLGVAPTPGQVVSVNYLRTNGKDADNIPSLQLASSIILSDINGLDYTVDPSNVTLSVISRSSGGADKEGIESIRQNAPFQYASQNRMVTANDYSALILKKYNTFIDDIKSWGGEDDPKPAYGSVFTSIVFKPELSNSTISQVRQGILDLVDEYSIASFDLRFTDPETTYIGTQTFFQWNRSLTGLSESTVRANVSSAIDQYFLENTGKFDQVFRRSNMLTRIDAVDPSVLSSRANVFAHQRIFPTLTLPLNYDITFPFSIRPATDSLEPSVYSSIFTYKNQQCFIRNKINERVKISAEGANPVIFNTTPSSTLELVTVGGKVLVSSIGEYFSPTGRVVITNLTIQSITAGRNFVKIFAVPANQSVVEAKLNTIIKYDPEESFVQTVAVDTR